MFKVLMVGAVQLIAASAVVTGVSLMLKKAVLDAIVEAHGITVENDRAAASRVVLAH